MLGTVMFAILEHYFDFMQARQECVLALEGIAVLYFNDFSILQSYFMWQFVYFSVRIAGSVYDDTVTSKSTVNTHGFHVSV